MHECRMNSKLTTLLFQIKSSVKQLNWIPKKTDSICRGHLVTIKWSVSLSSVIKCKMPHISQNTLHIFGPIEMKS